MQADLGELEGRLWDVADEMRANSGLKASEYGSPVLNLIFLRFAGARFEAARKRIEAKASARRKVGPSDYQAEGLIYLAPESRFNALLELPEGSDLGKAVNEAMRLVEEHNPELKGVGRTALSSAQPCRPGASSARPSPTRRWPGSGRSWTTSTRASREPA